MPLINDLLARVAHGVTQRVIELDDRARTQIAPVAGRVMQVQVTPLGLEFFIIAEQESIVVLEHYDGDIDATITGRPSQFIAVMRGAGTASAVRASGITIDGNLDVVESFAAVAKSLDPDIEEYVSRFVGDGPARKLGLAARRFGQWFDTTSSQVTEDAGYFLREDSGVLITAEQLSEFSDDVDELRADADRLEQRINRLRQSESS